MSIISIPRSYIINDNLDDELFIFILRLKSEFINGMFSVYDIPKLQSKLNYKQSTFLRLLDKSFDYHFLVNDCHENDFSIIEDYKAILFDYLNDFNVAYNLSNKIDLSILQQFSQKYNSIKINENNYRLFLRESFGVSRIMLKRFSRSTLYLNTFSKLYQKSFSLETHYKSLSIILNSISNILIYLRSDIVLRRKIYFTDPYIKKQYNTLLSTFNNINVDDYVDYLYKNTERKDIKKVNRFKNFKIQNKSLFQNISKYNNLKNIFNENNSLHIKINSFRPSVNQLKNRIPTTDRSNSINQFEWLQLNNYSTVKNLLIAPEISYKIDADFIKGNSYKNIKQKLAEIRIQYVVQYESKNISYTELSRYCKMCRSKTVELINHLVKEHLIYKTHFDSILIKENTEEFPSSCCYVHNNNLYYKAKNEYEIMKYNHITWQIGKKERKKYNNFLSISTNNPFKELKDKLQSLQNKNDGIKHFKVRFNNRTFYIYVNFTGVHFEVYKSTKNTYYRNFINGSHVEGYMLYNFLGKSSNTIMYSTVDYESVRFDNSQENFVSRFFNKKSNTNYIGNGSGFELLFNE